MNLISDYNFKQNKSYVRIKQTITTRIQHVNMNNKWRIGQYAKLGTLG